MSSQAQVTVHHGLEVKQEFEAAGYVTPPGQEQREAHACTLTNAQPFSTLSTEPRKRCHPEWAGSGQIS